MKNKLKLITAASAAIMLISGAAAAHSGRTDASGGHYDRSTGKYHYHHGRAAHQHPDGICPYISTAKPTAEIPESVIVTVSPNPGATHKYNYSSSSIRAPSHSSTPSSGGASTNKTNSTDNTGGIFACIFILGPLILYFIYCIIKWIDKKIKAWKEKRRRAKLPPYIKPEIIIKQSYTNPELVIQDAPERWRDIAIGEDTYPYNKTLSPEYDTRFIVFTTKSGSRYHRYSCAHIADESRITRRHFYYDLQMGYKPCAQCRPPSAVDPWYLELFPDRKTLYRYARQDIPEAEQKNPELAEVIAKPNALPLPPGIALNQNNLPYVIKNRHGYGRRYNAYITKNGTHYHRRKCEALKGDKKLIHVYEAIRDPNLKPCKMCNPKRLIDEWYTEIFPDTPE